MTEPKKRGPKPKCKECGAKHGEAHYDDCSVGLGVVNGADFVASLPVQEIVELPCISKAQAYALRVWNGQSIDAPRSWRIERVKQALAGQNLPFEGVVLPD